MLSRGMRRHLTTILLTIAWLRLCQCLIHQFKPEAGLDESWRNSTLDFITNIIRTLVAIAFPFTLCNLLGLVLFSLYPEIPGFKTSPLLAPFICLRVVTRGNYADLVQENVERNLELCHAVGLENFVIEVVTDQPVFLKRSNHVKELVVPKDYTTKSGSLFKARALQYSLETDINILNNEDWIVHMDEETRLTESCLYGIVNFISDGKSQFGQGAIYYASGVVVNWVTTLIDSIRVAVDYGALRFCLKVFHKPVFNWKGSYVVANVGAEIDVSFDHGPEGSIAEDCFFGAVAIAKGYRFDFIDGHMCEQSTFTLMDYVRQRKRWFNGILLTVLSSKIQLRHKLGLILLMICGITMPLTVVLFPLTTIYPYPMSTMYAYVIFPTIGATYPCLFIVGAAVSLNHTKHSWMKYLTCLLVVQLLIPLTLVLENLAVISGCFSRKMGNFYIVEKNIQTKQKANLGFTIV